MTDTARSPRTADCLSAYALDKLLTGGLAAAVADEKRAHIAGCSRCARLHDQTVAHKECFAASPPPLRGLGDGADDSREPGEASSDVVSLTAARARRNRSLLRWMVPAGSALAAAAAALIFITAGPGPSDMVEPGAGPSAGTAQATRTKGALRIELFLAREGLVHELLPGGIARPDDTLQLAYSTTSPGYLAVLSRDGAGVGSVYFPGEQSHTVAVTPGENVALPQATILDHTLGQESLFVLFCAHAVELEPLRQALERQGSAVSWPEGCRVETLTFTKQPVPAGMR